MTPISFCPKCSVPVALCACLALSAFEHEPQKHVDTPVPGAGFLPNPIAIIVTSAVTSRAVIITPAGVIPMPLKPI
jgi:hypothetical protein